MSIYVQKRPQVYPREFNRQFSENAKISEEEAEIVAEAFIGTIVESLLQNRSICFPDFGVFELREITPRMGRNPKTMEEYAIQESLKPVFRPSKALKSAVAEYAKERKASGREIADTSQDADINT